MWYFTYDRYTTWNCGVESYRLLSIKEVIFCKPEDQSTYSFLFQLEKKNGVIYKYRMPSNNQ